MENFELSRRGFLKFSWIALWAFSLWTFLDTGLDFFGEKNPDSKDTKAGDKNSKESNFLDRSFETLKNWEFWENSNFLLFLKILETLDEEIFIRTWLKLGYKNNTIAIPCDIKNRDIPELINIIEANTHSRIIKENILKIKNEYLNNSKALILMWKESKDSHIQGVYFGNAYKNFTIYCLYNKIKDPKKIEDSFKKLVESEIKDTWELTEQIENLKSKELEFVNENKNTLLISQAQRRSLLEDSKKDPGKAFLDILSIVKSFIDWNKEIENKWSHYLLVKNILSTTYKTEEIILPKNNNWANWPLIISEIIKKTEDIFSIKNDNKLKKFEETINSETQNNIKRNFEWILYYLMVDNTKKIETIATKKIETWFKNINKEEIKKDFFYSYIWSEFTKKEITEMFWKGKLWDLDSKIARLPKPHQLNINNKIKDIESIFNNPQFKIILGLLENSKFGEIKSNLEKLKMKDRKITLFVIYKTFWRSVNSILDSEDKLSWHYAWDTFEIKKMKDTKYMLNCMTIAALTNNLSEKLFWIETSGVIFIKHKWEFKAHMANAIKLWNEYLIVDSTFDECYFKNKNDFDKVNTYDVDKFSNSFINSAYYNINSRWYEKFIDNKLYNLYVKYVSRKDFDYLNFLINNWWDTYVKTKNKNIKIE